MNLSENLHYLRKRDKITQEELADRLRVSRQAVSKWETGEAYPETDKLITLCDMFKVSLDELVRGNVVREEEEEPQPVQDNGAFIAHMNRFSRSISAGVFLILLGVSVCVLLSGYAESVYNYMPELTYTMGVIVLLIFVAIAVFLFVYSGINHDRFCKEHPTVSGVYAVQEVRAFSKRFALAMALLVSGILIDVVFIVVTSALIEEGILYAQVIDEAMLYVTAAFLFVLSFLVGGLVYFGIQHTKYNTEEYNKQTGKDLNPSPRSKLKDAICGAIMMSATAIFLVIGFVWHLWHPGWVVFPVGGIICGIVGAVMGAKDDH